MNKIEEIKYDLYKYGIRNTIKTSKPPLEMPSRTISNQVSGIEPFFLKNLKLEDKKNVIRKNQ